MSVPVRKQTTTTVNKCFPLLWSSICLPLVDLSFVCHKWILYVSIRSDNIKTLPFPILHIAFTLCLSTLLNLNPSISVVSHSYAMHLYIYLGRLACLLVAISVRLACSVMIDCTYRSICTRYSLNWPTTRLLSFTRDTLCCIVPLGSLCVPWRALLYIPQMNISLDNCI